MFIQDISVVVDDGARSQAVSISGTSAQSTDIDAEVVLVTLTTPGFVRQGRNPTSTSDGTDIYLLADTTYRLNLKRGNKLAFNTTGGTGTAYLTPGA